MSRLTRKLALPISRRAQPCFQRGAGHRRPLFRNPVHICLRPDRRTQPRHDLTCRHPQRRDAGFEYAGASEIDANPKDTKDYPQGVWTLPPVLALGDQDREKYLAIGEADNFVLKFRKPAH